MVEDHAILAEVTADFLRGSGLEVLVAESGYEALTLALKFRPGIVLCDLNLPDMSGIDVARALRKDPATKNVLFVIHSALMETELDDVSVRNVDLFLSKPMDKEKLKKILSLKTAT